MYKCPKCGYQSEAEGACPTDNETLILEQASTEPTSTPEATAAEEQKPQE